MASLVQRWPRTEAARAGVLDEQTLDAFMARVAHVSETAYDQEVHEGLADYGLVPVENSTDGRIADTLDNFIRYFKKLDKED